MRRALTYDYLLNSWLQKYHNITVDELREKEPELIKTPKWYKKYAVTQEQYDEWYKWAINEIAKSNSWSIKTAERQSVFAFLNLAPSIITET